MERFMQINFDLGPAQPPITPEKITEMIHWVPRRFRLCDFDQPLKAPGEMGPKQQDWNLRFPFEETFIPAFEEMCSVDHVPFSTRSTASFTFLKQVTDKDIEGVKTFLQTLAPFVAIRDCLAISFAIDYDRENGNPSAPQTHIGRLRSLAKPYDKKPTLETYSAADKLAQECVMAIHKLTCYNSATCIVAMPPSDPEKLFDLPKHLATQIATALNKPDKSDKAKTVRVRPGNKGLPCDKKLPNIEGTVEVSGDAFKDEIVLLIDDLYQSGVTMNYVAMLLLDAGAKKIFGLSCEKTCSNDDNVSRR